MSDHDGEDGEDGEDGDKFDALTKAYKKNPSIEHYVKLRRENPHAEIEVSVFGGIDPLLFMEPELVRFGIDPLLVASVMDADTDAISKLCLQLLDEIIAARSLTKCGETHLGRRGLAIPDKLINWLIAVMLDSLSWNDSLYLPRDLIVLIRERLSGSNLEYTRAEQAHRGRQMAILNGGRLMAMGRKPSFRLIADLLEVAPSTVKRWFPEGDFLKEVEKESRSFDENGEFSSANSVPNKRLKKSSRKEPVEPLRRK